MMFNSKGKTHFHSKQMSEQVHSRLLQTLTYYCFLELVEIQHLQFVIIIQHATPNQGHHFRFSQQYPLSHQTSVETRLLLSVRPTPRGVGGWVGLAEFQGGWVSNPPPPGVGWDSVGALGSIEPVPLLSFFCCRFHVTCLFMVCLHGIAYHVCMPHAHKGARMHCHLCQMRRGQR